MEKRGLSTGFLSPHYEDLKDPFFLLDMKKAVARIKKAVENGEQILIYGDYDVDGVTASIVMEKALRMAGVTEENIEIMLPDRFADGYGMSPKLIVRAKQWGAGLVITVDCGSNNHEIIDELNSLGIDCIVTDHHEISKNLPEAFAVVNPKRKDFEDEDLKNLAGVGVAFKLTQALVKEGLIEPGREKWLLDLVLIGTVCDNMLLIGENHTLGFYGLKVLVKTRLVGLRELMKRAGVKHLNSESIGFQIGPRLNAAGRLKTAELSLNLLRCDSVPEAATITEELEDLNKKRKIEQNSATNEIKKRGVLPGPVIIETGKWHEGILGIVAGRLMEEYEKPTFVLTEMDNGILKGSGRSFGDFSLDKALKYAGDIIVSGGGHAAAAGVKIKQEDLWTFREKINEYYESLNLKNQTDYLKSQPDLEVENIGELNLELMGELKRLEPFGQGNEEPIFLLKGVKIHEIRKMGSENQHLRIDVMGKDGKIMKLVAFFAPKEWMSFDPEYDRIEPVIKLVENEFNGVRSVEGRILDINMV